jgi:hypothetical protein
MTRMNGKHVPSLVMTLEGQLVTTSRLVFTDRNLNWRHQVNALIENNLCAQKSIGDEKNACHDRRWLLIKAVELLNSHEH